MPVSPLIPFNVDLPAQNGINSEAVSGSLDSSWAERLTNIVYDSFGRICSRKAFNKLTTTPIADNPEMTALFEYVKNSATTYIISVDADGNLYHGTGTLTDITGSVSITDTHLQFANFEGEVIGVGQAEDPIYWDSTSNFETLHSKHTAWQASTAYSQGDCVKAVASATTDYYLVCSTAGTTGGTEPTWSATEGATTNDNTAVWTTVTFPKGRCILSAYGRVWILREDRTTIDYSALAEPHKFDTLNGGGTVDTKAVLGRNDDFITSIATFNNNLVIFSRFNTLVYSNINSPSNLAIVDQIVGTGCIARDTVKNIGNDLIFLSYQGLRSLGRTIELEKVPLSDISVAVRTELVDEVNSNLASITDDTPIKCEYSPIDGIYILKIADIFYVFDFKKAFYGEEFVPPRVTTWTSIGTQSLALSRDGVLYMAKAGAVGKYDGYSEWGLSQGSYQDSVPYLLSYRSAWMDFREVSPELINRLKMVKKFNIDMLGGTSYDIDFTLSYDFTDTVYRRTKTIPVADGSQWNLGEWGLAEWSGDTARNFAMVNTAGSGDHVQMGLDCNVDGAIICIQNITLWIKVGRGARGSARS